MKTSRNALILVAASLLLAAVFFIMRGTGTSPRSSAPAAAATPAATNTQTRSSAATQRPEPSEADALLQSEGVATDVSLTTFPLREYRHIDPPAGKPAGSPGGVAYIHVPSSRTRTAVEPNQLGEYPAVDSQPNETVGVRIQLPETSRDTPVRVVILDGGDFPLASGPSQLLGSAKWGGVAFEFTTSGNYGTHRLLVQVPGQPSRVLDFNVINEADGWPPPSISRAE